MADKGTPDEFIALLAKRLVDLAVEKMRAGDRDDLVEKMRARDRLKNMKNQIEELKAAPEEGKGEG